jgi:acetyl-CoA carboxylase beta subunit
MFPAIWYQHQKEILASLFLCVSSNIYNKIYTTQNLTEVYDENLKKKKALKLLYLDMIAEQNSNRYSDQVVACLSKLLQLTILIEKWQL